MRVINETPFRVGRVRASFDARSDALVLLVKGTFRIVPDGVATALPSDAQLRPCLDLPYADRGGSEVYYPSDYAPYKPRADLLVVGSAHAPGGQPVTRLDVAVTVGNHRKSLVVHGDRHWLGDGEAASPPEPFLAMPLTWSRAYGSDDFLANPLGRGRYMPWNGDVTGRRPLPNVEFPDAPVTAPECEVGAAGFAPIGGTAPSRLARAGQRDRRWMNREAPVPPDDFDWSYHNAAPEDQQIDGFFRGDETIGFENMHPDHPRLETRLPGLRVQAIVLRDEAGAPEPVDLVLDTVWADVSRERLVLAWRGRIMIQDSASPRTGPCATMVVAAPLDAEPEAPDRLAARLRQRLARTSRPSVSAPAVAEAAAAEALREAREAVPEAARDVASGDDPVALIAALAGTMPGGQNNGAATRQNDRDEPTGRS